MERKQPYNKIDRSTKNILNNIKHKVTRNTVVAPEILVGHVWMQDEETNGVEIIELNSSNDTESSEDPPIKYSHAWGCANNDNMVDNDEYKINSNARERRRHNHEQDFAVSYESIFYDDEINYNGDHNSKDFSGVPLNHQMNCFTIINNHIINSDSSSDQEYAIGIVEPEADYWDQVYNDEVILNSTDENRTIWIYSFKNKRLLSEHDYKLTNIPATDTNFGAESFLNSSSTSNTSEKIKDKRAEEPRVASPIPSYVPRLDLSLVHTLSTVTEVSEAKPWELEEALHQKPLNNWLTERVKTKTDRGVSNVIQWMGLSPRERRRRFKNTESTAINTKPETLIHVEGNRELLDDKKSDKVTSTLVQVDVHAIDEETVTSNGSTFSVVNGENIKLETVIENDHIVRIENETSAVLHDMQCIEEDTPISTPDIKLKSRKPHISLNLKINKTKISSPIQKLNSKNWITEEKLKVKTAKSKDPVSENIVKNENDASRRLFENDIKLMRVPIWSNYYPITETPPSLHLSISYSSIEERSCLNKIASCFKCFR